MRRLVSTSVVAALLLVMGMATTAHAQYPPAGDLTIACTPELPVAGQTVTCTISGAPGNTVLDIVVRINPVIFEDSVTTDADGQATFSFTVPEDAQPGDIITITVSGAEIEGTLEVQLTVADEVIDDEEEDLPDTGLDAGPLVLIGLLIAAVGIGAVVAARRRDRSGTSA